MPKVTRRLVRQYPSKAVSGLFLTSDKEYVADVKPDDGTRVRKNFGTDKERAFMLYDALLVEIENARQERENPLVVDFLNGTFLDSQRHLKAFDFVEWRVRAIVKFLEARYPNLRLAEVRRLHAEALLDFYAEQSPRTISGNLQKFKQALNHAVDLELLDANPLARVKSLRFDNRRMETASLDDFVRIIKASEKTDVQGVFLMVGLTGLRPNNVLNLRKEHVIADTIRIEPERMKNGRWGIVPISGYVRDYLAGRNPSSLFFPCQDDPNKPKSRHNVRRAWEHVVRRLGLEHLTLYDLRHGFATWLAESGASETQIGALLTHKGGSVTSRYIHSSLESLRPFVERLSERFVETCGSGDVTPERVVPEGRGVGERHTAAVNASG